MIAKPAVAEESIESAIEGRLDRFGELFETYQAALRRLVSAYVSNSADREDLLQEIAAGIWKSLPGFRGDSSERTWIYRIAHNIAMRTSSRVQAQNARERLIEGPFELASGDASAENALLIRERQRALLKAIRELAVVDRQLVALYLEGLSAVEIEEVTGISRGGVATRLTRIRQRLAGRV